MTPEDETGDDIADAPDGEEDIAVSPSDVADPQAVVDRMIPDDLRDKYEVYSYRNAAVILNETRPAEFAELVEMLRGLSLTTTMIRIAGGNESDIPKIFSTALRPKGWYETRVQGDLNIRLLYKEFVGLNAKGNAKYIKGEKHFMREQFLDGHKIDYVKNRVAFDLEWNSKDQTFDRDLYAFNAFAQCGVIDAAVLVTRGASLTPMLRQLGPALSKAGDVEFTKAGKPRTTAAKYGASTTWMGKLLYRLNAGRNGACPVLAVGITPKCIKDWNDDETA